MTIDQETGNALDHLRKLLAKGSVVEAPAWDYCFWCEAESPNETDHADNCPWAGAKGFIEKVDAEDAQLERDCAAIDRALGVVPLVAKGFIQESDAAPSLTDACSDLLNFVLTWRDKLPAGTPDVSVINRARRALDNARCSGVALTLKGPTNA